MNPTPTPSSEGAPAEQAPSASTQMLEEVGISHEREEAPEGTTLRVSWSQVSHACGYQVKYHRERAPRGPMGVSLSYGTAFHAGVEYHLLSRRGIDAAVKVAIQAMRDEVETADMPGMRPLRWDPPPRITQRGKPYAVDRGNVHDLDRACEMLAFEVRSYLERYGHIRLIDGGVERRIWMHLTRPAGAVVECILDLLPDDDGIVDLKTAKKPWDTERIREKVGQARLYQAAFVQHYERPPRYFRFHNVIKGSDPLEIQVLEVPFDPDAINRFLNHTLRPNLAAIAAEAYIPNDRGWQCSERYCDWWEHCPLGAAAHAQPLSVFVPMELPHDRDS